MSMKKVILTTIATVVAAVMSFSAQAQPSQPAAPSANAPAPGQAMVAGGDKHPCHVIEEACKAAGFVKGGYKTGKGLFKNCMGPVLSGQAVNGVTVNPADVQACLAKHPPHQ